MSLYVYCFSGFFGVRHCFVEAVENFRSFFNFSLPCISHKRKFSNSKIDTNTHIHPYRHAHTHTHLIQEQEIPYIGYKQYRLSDTKKNTTEGVLGDGRRLRLGLKSKTETKQKQNKQTKKVT